MSVARDSEYVVGFLFSSNRESVVLIRKNRPNWQAGCLNGIGGKIEPGESPEAAMRREFEEEAGVSLPSREWLDTWEPFATISGPEKTPGEISFRVHYFRCFSDAILNLESCTDEPVATFDVLALFTYFIAYRTVTNLRWLIQMALSMDTERARAFEITEVGAA